MIVLFDERTPADRLTCQWGALVSAITPAASSAAGSAAAGAAGSAAAGAAGSGLASGLGTALGNAATGLAQNTGLSSLYNAGSNLLAGGGEAGYLQSLGQAVPQGVELAGPSGAGGFWQGLQQGFQGVLGGQGPSVANQAGQGLGMLGNYAMGQTPAGQTAGQLLRSALSAYGLGDTGGVRPYTGGPGAQPQNGLLSLHIGGSTGVS